MTGLVVVINLVKMKCLVLEVNVIKMGGFSRCSHCGKIGGLVVVTNVIKMMG